MTQKYDPYELLQNLPTELRRAQKESPALNELLELLPYVSCETPVTFGGTEPHLTCNATNAREMADVIVNWQAEKLRFALILAWPQAKKNRAAAEALEQAWLPKPLPFATRIHGPGTDSSQTTLLKATAFDSTGETVFPDIPQLHQADPILDDQGVHILNDLSTTTELPELYEGVPENYYTDEKVDEIIVDNLVTESEELPQLPKPSKELLLEFLNDNAHLTFSELIDSLHDNDGWLLRLTKSINMVIDDKGFDGVFAPYKYHCMYIYELYAYGSGFAHAHLALKTVSDNPNSTDDDIDAAQRKFDSEYSYDAYFPDTTKEQDLAYGNKIVRFVNSDAWQNELEGWHRELDASDDYESIFVKISIFILKGLGIDMPVKFSDELSETQLAGYKHMTGEILLSRKFFAQRVDRLHELVDQMPALIAGHEVVHRFQRTQTHHDGTPYSEADIAALEKLRRDIRVPGVLSFFSYTRHPIEAQTYQMTDYINKNLGIESDYERP